MRPSQLPGHAGRVSLTGVVVGPVRGDPHGSGMRFSLRDRGTARRSTEVAIVYTGEVSEQFRVGREIVLDGTFQNGTFVGVPGSLLTKCPSRYTAKSQGQ